MSWSQLSKLIQQLLVPNFCPDICSKSVIWDAQWCYTSRLRPPYLRYFAGVLLSAVVTGNAIKEKKINQWRTLKPPLEVKVKSVSHSFYARALPVLPIKPFSLDPPLTKIFHLLLLKSNVSSQHQCSMVFNSLIFCKKYFIKILISPNVDEDME